MNNILLNDLLIFSDGSVCFEFNNYYNNKKIKYLKKDFKLYQKSIKKQSLNNFQELNKVTNYRKKLFK